MAWGWCFEGDQGEVVLCDGAHIVRAILITRFAGHKAFCEMLLFFQGVGSERQFCVCMCVCGLRWKICVAQDMDAMCVYNKPERFCAITNTTFDLSCIHSLPELLALNVFHIYIRDAGLGAVMLCTHTHTNRLNLVLLHHENYVIYASCAALGRVDEYCANNSGR